MGLPLFEHVGRNVEPTEAGHELYDACRRMFDILANLEMKVADLKGMKRGRLRLAVITTAKYVVPELLGEFSRLYPGIELALKVTNRDRIIERMQANEDDLYIMVPVMEEDLDVESHPFSLNPLVVMAPRDHPLVGQKQIPVAEIARHPFIIREPGSGIRDITFKTFAAHGVRPEVNMELGSNEAIKHAIVAGLGLSVLSLHTLTLEGTDGPVAVLDVEGFPILRHWAIVYPRGKELSLVARTFLEFAVGYEPNLRRRMMEMWPALRKTLDSQMDAKGKKKASRRQGKKSPRRKTA
jgi:DNA-binding transcriptional LysR family regulator